MTHSNDAFLIHDPTDAFLAQAVAERFEASQLSVFSPILHQPDRAQAFSELARRMLWQSETVVVLLTPAAMNSDLVPSFCGAALVTRPAAKFVLNAGVHNSDVPDFLEPNQYTHAALWDGLPAVVNKVSDLVRPLAPNTVATLRRLAAAVGITLRTADSANQRMEFARQYTAETGVAVDAHRLVRQWFRYRSTARKSRIPQTA